MLSNLVHGEQVRRKVYIVHYYMTVSGHEKKKKNSVVLVSQQTIPIERSPPVSEASANFSG
jgi:hypothetical protein